MHHVALHKKEILKENTFCKIKIGFSGWKITLSDIHILWGRYEENIFEYFTKKSLLYTSSRNPVRNEYPSHVIYLLN